MKETLYDQDIYFDVKSLSRYSSLSIRTLRNYLSDPADPIPSYRVKRKLLIKKSDFDTWLENHRMKEGEVASQVDAIIRDLVSN